MTAIMAGIRKKCGSSNTVNVRTGEAFVNTMLDQLLPNGFPSIAEAQLGAFSASYKLSGATVNITVSNPITLNSLLLHALASNQNDNPEVNVPGDTLAGSGLDRLGRLSGNVPFGQ